MTVEELIAALQSGNVEPSTDQEVHHTVILRGMAKLVDGDKSSLHFAPGVNCSQWLAVPLIAIEEIEPLGAVPCRDHKHDLVLIQLKQPTTPEAQFLSQLLQHTNELLANAESVSIPQLQPITEETEEVEPRVEGFGLAGLRPPRIRLPRPSIPRPSFPAIPPLIPPQINRASHFSQCAKCMMWVDAAVTAIVIAASGGAGVVTAEIEEKVKHEFGDFAAESILKAIALKGPKEALYREACRRMGKC